MLQQSIIYIHSQKYTFTIISFHSLVHLCVKEKRRITDEGEKLNRRKKQKNVQILKDSDWLELSFKPATYDMMYSYSSSDSDSEYYEEDEIIDLEEESGVANEESAAVNSVRVYIYVCVCVCVCTYSF